MVFNSVVTNDKRRSLVASPASFHLWTIGCQMNLADSQRLESALVQLGLHSVESPKDADDFKDEKGKFDHLTAS